MKHGAFLLITGEKDILSRHLTGALQFEGLQTHHLSTARAVLIDARLEESAQAQVRGWCCQKRIPAFTVVLPCEQDDERTANPIEVISEFMINQNEREPLTHSQETLARLHMQTLVDIITTANSHLEPKQVMESVMMQIHRLIDCEAWSVLILEDDDSDTLGFAAAYGPDKDRLEGLQVPLGQGIAGWVAMYRQPVIVGNAQEDPRFLAEIDKHTSFKTRNILCAPLISRGRTLGVIEMLNRKDENCFSESDLELVQILVNPAAVAIENAFLFQKAQMLTIQDDLTKLFNSRHLNYCLEVEIRRARRNCTPLSLMFLDLDGFKAVNDNYGHLQGSQSLIDIGRIIRESARDTDIVGRYGGDEFVLILPETDVDGAKQVAERIRSKIEEYKLKDINLTASIGISGMPRHGYTKETLIRLADKAMYSVKDKGKNGIIIADGIDPN